MDEQNDGFSSLFYIMLILGIIGVIGFVFVAAGAAAGADEEPPISGAACIPVPPVVDISGCDKVFLPVVIGGQ